MLSVMVLTIIVAMLCAVIIRGMVLVLGSMSKAAPAPAAAAPAPRPAAVDAGPPIAAITAAIYAVLGYHRIVHIEDSRGHGWTAEGRLLHQASHNVPHHPHVDIR